MSNLQKTTVPAVLTPVDTDDFLPPLGGWSQRLGQRVLLAATGSLVVLAVWPWRETVRASGVIRPAGENTLVQSQLDGSVIRVLVKENQQVRQGEALAELDRRRLDDERQKLEAELRQSLAQQLDNAGQSDALRQQSQATQTLNNAQRLASERDRDSAAANLRFRETELKRYRSLLASGAVAALVVEEKQAQAELARNDLAKALQSLRQQRASGQAELARLQQGGSQATSQGRELGKLVEQARSRLAEVRRALANSTIQAPSAGVVIASSLRHPLQVIRAGEVLAQIAPLDGHLQVKVSVGSRDIGPIRPGQRAYLRVAGCPYPEFGVMPAKVLAVSADSINSQVSGNGALGNSAIGNGGVVNGASFQVSLKPTTDRMQAGRRSCKLRHGMDVQADIVTRDSTVLGFLFTKLRLNTGA